MLALLASMLGYGLATGMMYVGYHILSRIFTIHYALKFPLMQGGVMMFIIIVLSLVASGYPSYRAGRKNVIDTLKQ